VTVLSNAVFQRRVSEAGRASDGVWLAGLVVGVLFTMIAAYGFTYPGSISGKFWAYAGLLLRSSLYLWAGDR
jgi:hypothetical protein